MTRSEPTGRWIVAYSHVARSGTMHGDPEAHHPLVVAAVYGHLKDEIDLWRRHQEAEEQEQAFATGYDKQRETGDAVVDAWEQTLARGEIPKDW